MILIGDLDSAKEVELHYLAEMFLRRSCSVFYFDVPGQGELYGKGSIADGFDRALSSVIDFLRRDPRVGVTSIGSFGIGLGGHLACRAAAGDSRIDACISISGFFDSAILEKLPLAQQSRFLKIFGLSTQDAGPRLGRRASLAPLKGRMKAPLLLVHGTADPVVDIKQMRALQKWASGPVDTLVLEGAEHLCCDRFNECLPTIGDWMTNWLLHRNTQQVALI